MDLVLVGLNHKTAPVEIRERIAFAEEHLQPALRRLQKDSDLQEGMIVSTCNRVEILAHGQKSQAQIVQSVKDFLYSYHTLKPPFLEDYLYSYQRGDAVRHVFRVASSLDSMVVGEPQILAQVKQAYAEACQAGSVGTYLKDLIPRAFSWPKRSEARLKLETLPYPSAPLPWNWPERSLGISRARQLFSWEQGKWVSWLRATSSTLESARSLS